MEGYTYVFFFFLVLLWKARGRRCGERKGGRYVKKGGIGESQTARSIDPVWGFKRLIVARTLCLDLSPPSSQQTQPIDQPPLPQRAPSYPKTQSAKQISLTNPPSPITHSQSRSPLNILLFFVIFFSTAANSHSTHSSPTHPAAPAGSNCRPPRPWPARSRRARTPGSRPCSGRSRRLCRRRFGRRRGLWL